EALRRGGISMMISDVRMPGMSGLETLRQARQEHSVLPVLLVTAYADIREAVGAMRDGAVNYLAKPIDLDELLASVRQATGISKKAPSPGPSPSGSAGSNRPTAAQSFSTKSPRCPRSFRPNCCA